MDRSNVSLDTITRALKKSPIAGQIIELVHHSTESVQVAVESVVGTCDVLANVDATWAHSGNQTFDGCGHLLRRVAAIIDHDINDRINRAERIPKRLVLLITNKDPHAIAFVHFAA